jgi:hypothetical protein
MAGNLQITSLPAPMAHPYYLLNTGMIGQLSGINIGASTYQFSLISPGSSAQGFRVMGISGTAGSIYLQASNIRANTTFALSGTVVYQC